MRCNLKIYMYIHTAWWAQAMKFLWFIAFLINLHIFEPANLQIADLNENEASVQRTILTTPAKRSLVIFPVRRFLLIIIFCAACIILYSMQLFVCVLFQHFQINVYVNFSIHSFHSFIVGSASLRLCDFYRFATLKTFFFEISSFRRRVTVDGQIVHDGKKDKHFTLFKCQLTGNKRGLATTMDNIIGMVRRGAIKLSDIHRERKHW
jgi:hypothetical protein